MSQNESSVNNQQTSFSFGTDILGRYFCNTLDEAMNSAESRPFDLVVIGSGMYGSYIASKLYHWSKKQKELGFEKRLKVLILEAGPYLLYEHIENLPPKTDGIFGENNKPPYMKSPYVCHVKRSMQNEVYFGKSTKEITKHNYCVGGKSLTWGKWSPRLTDGALEAWPREVVEFLNASYKEDDDDEPKSNYRRVEEEIGVSDDSNFVRGTLVEGLRVVLRKSLEQPDFQHLILMNPPVAATVNSAVSGQYSSDAFSSVGRLLQNIRIESELPDVPAAGDPSWKSKSFFLVPNATVYELETEGNRVSRINMVYGASKEKRSFTLSNQCDVILAGTAVESTRLALNSFPRATNSQPELIGRNLMGHLFSSVGVRIRRKAFGFRKDEALQPALYHIQHSNEKFKNYHFQLFCSSSSTSESNFEKGIFEILYKMFYDDEQLVDTLKLQRSEWIYILALSCSEVKGKPECAIYTEDSNWMDLSKDQWEEFGEVKCKQPYLKWQSSQADEEFWDEVLSTLFKLLSSLADPSDIEYYYPNNPENDRWKKDKPTQFDQYQSTEAFWNSRHESGTLWMGENADKSVTDLDGKLHHVQNVYCADQAIFPTVGSANPVLTGLTLDRKIAQAIIDRHKNFPDDFDPKGVSNEFDLESQGFRRILDGTLKNWSFQDQSEYKLLPDEILELQPRGRHGVAWYNLETFSEFDLIVDWKAFDYSTNSGIVIHSPDPSKDRDDVYKFGYEIQIDESGYDHVNNIYGSPSHKTGAIYGLASANRGNTKKLGLWNRFRIISTRSEIKAYLNGKSVSSLSLLEENKNTEGYICLQFHTNKIQFRNILVREHQKNE